MSRRGFFFPGLRGDARGADLTASLSFLSPANPPRRKNYHIKVRLLRAHPFALARSLTRSNGRIQATAIIRSSFREVLYLDSDNIPAASLLPLDVDADQSVSNRTNADGKSGGEASTPAGLWESCVPSLVFPLRCSELG